MLNASHYHLFDFIINAYFSTRAHNFRCASIITEHCIAPFQQLQHAKNSNIWSTYEAYKSHSFFHLKIYFFHFHARMVCIPAVVFNVSNTRAHHFMQHKPHWDISYLILFPFIVLHFSFQCRFFLFISFENYFYFYSFI